MSHQRKHLRAILREATRIAEAHGVALSIARAGGHPKLVLEGRGRRRSKPICSTPRDCDAAINMALQDVRRICREMCA